MVFQMNKIEILQNSKTHRQENVDQYQINIDNYTLAIAEIEQNHVGDESLAAFKQQLESLLKSEIAEQKKEMIMITVINKQLENSHAG
jgi:hypothetical protein